MRFDDDDMFYDDEEVINDEEVDLENRFYDAKCEMEENLESAIEQFEMLIADDEMSENKTEWGYKSIRKLCRHFAKTSNKEKFEEYFEKYLEYISIPSVSKVEKSVFLLLGVINVFGEDYVFSTNERLIEHMSGNGNFSRIVFRLNIRKAQTLFDQNKLDELEPFLNTLVASCFLPNGKEDPMRSHLLVDIYAIQLQLYSSKNDLRKLQQICGKVNFSERNIANPRVNGTIMMCSGRIKLINGNYKGARDDFNSAFTNYNEASVPEADDAFKCFVMADMLSGSTIDIFSDQSVNHAAQKGVGKILKEIYITFHSDNVLHFIELVKQNKENFTSCPLIAPYEKELIERAQRKLILRYANCFKKVKMSFLAKQLGSDDQSVELVVLKMIFEGTLKAKINQFDRHLVITEEQGTTARTYLAVTELSKQMFSAISL